MAATVAIVRALVGDDGATEIKSDAHYTTIIGLETNPYRAAALAARTLAAHFSQKVATTVGPMSMENQQKAENFRALASEYDRLALTSSGGDPDPNGLGTPVVSGTSISAMDAVEDDTDRYDSAFYRGMHDNSGTCAYCGCLDCICGCD